MKLVVAGLPATKVASKLGVSRRTVESHLHHVYNKLDVHSRQELQAVVNSTDGIMDPGR